MNAIRLARTFSGLALLLSVFGFVSTGVPAARADSFFTISPLCRKFDSRDGGGPLQAKQEKTIRLTDGPDPGNPNPVSCGVPADATAVSINLTITQATAGGHIAVYPGPDTNSPPDPPVSTINFTINSSLSNNAVVKLAGDGSGTVNFLPLIPLGATVHLIIDINGYFALSVPVAENDTYPAVTNTPLNVNAAAGVTNNDALNGGAIVSYGATTGAEQSTIGAATPTSGGGSITLNLDGSFVYQPPTDFAGSDSFKYILQGTGGSDTGTVILAVSQATQTISFTSTAPAGATVSGPTYTVTATATSSLPVTFTIDASASTVCTIAGSTVSFIGVGTCVINANQAGDATYSAAPQVQQSFAVGMGDQTISFTSTAPAGATVGGPTYAVTATATSGLPVTFTIDASASAVCTIAGSTVSFIGVGTCVVDANQAGNANYNAAPQVQQSFAVGVGNQTISFTSTAPAGATVGGPTYAVTATATSGLPVALTIDASASSVCTIAGSTVSFIGVGTCVINANQAGDANYNPAPQVQQSFGVGIGNQTISFTSTAPAGATVGGPIYTVTATATSGLPVTFTIDASASTVCTIAGSTVSFIGAGTCVINANQAGDANYNPAPQVQQSFAVAKGDQTISFTSTAPAGATVGGPTYAVTATATSGLTVAFTIDASASTVCTIAGSTVSFIGIGTCVINANQPGDANYNAAPQVQQSFPVGKGNQTISFTSTAPVGAMVGGPTYTVTATATSGLPVTFTIDASASTVCTIAGSTVSFIGVGTCVINANQAGNVNYNAAPQVQQSFAVAKGNQTITFTSTAPVGAMVSGPTYTVTATASPSGLPVTFTIDASASTVCTIAGSTVSFIGAGTCVINANQAGDANYNAAPQVQQSFAVAKGDQTISFNTPAPVNAKVGGPTYAVAATATSGLTVAFTIDASATSVCSIAGSTVSFIGVGTCVINANQAGNANYNAAPQVQQSFLVAKGDQTISFTSTAPAGAKVGGPTYTVTATATSGLPVAFTIDPSASTVCTIAGSTVSFIGVGTCVINANQAGNANYNAAPQVQQSFLVAKGDQTISFTSTAPVGAAVGGPTYTVTATATSGLPVTFTIDASASSVCSIAGSTVSFIGAGTCVINANQAGNGTYNAAPQVQQSFAVAKGNQTISFTSSAPVGAQVGGPTYTVTATATSGLPVTFTIDASATSVCSIAGSTVSFIGGGTCVINANQPGNANYNAAPQVQQSFVVVKQDQTITFTSTPPALATVSGPTYTVTATATSGLTVTFTIDASATSVCTVAGSTVSFIGGGTCVINANQAGNTTYNAAPQVQQSFAVNHPPQLVTTPGFPKENFDTAGNTAFEFKAAQSLSPGVFVSGQLKDNFTDSDGPSPLSVIAINAGPTTHGGKVDVDTNGRFTFTPKAGDTVSPDSFSYQITDGAYTLTRTVTINLKHRVWYVKNNQPVGGLGRSTDPFDTLVEAETASVAGDTIYLFEGDGTTLGQSDGITLKNGQRLLGEAVVLAVPTTVTINGTAGLILRSTTGNRPKIEKVGAAGAPEDNGVSVPATAGSMIGVEIRGLDIKGFDNAIDVTATGANNANVRISDDVISGAGLEGVDVNAGSTGTVTLAVSDNSFTATGTGLDITRTNGTLIIAAFANNAVSGTTGGSGIVVNGPATFDSTSLGGAGPVVGGSTVIGASGDPVNGAGLVLNTVTGALDFTDLDVFAGNAAGVSVVGTGAYTGAAGTRLTVGAGVGIVEATGGPAVSVNNATINLQLVSLKSTSTTSTGVSLTNVSDGTTNAVFSAGSGTITTTAGASGPIFNVSGGNASISYPGTINNSSSAARAVSISGWSGDDAGDDILFSGAITENGAGILVNGNSGSGRSITFSGGMTIATTTGEGFAATSNTNTGGLHITGTNTISSTSATALRVTSTPIGNSGLNFRSISSGTAGLDSSTVGIVLDSTGTAAGNGSLTVTGTGSANSGGTIQRKTGGDGSTTSGIGIYLNNTKNPSFNWMLLRDFQNYAIRGIAVSGFTLANSTVDVSAYSSNGTSVAIDEASISFGSRAPSSQTGLTGNASITNTAIRRGFEDTLSVFNWGGTLDLTIDNCVIRDTTGNDGVIVEAHNNADVSVDVKNSDFMANVGDHFQATADDNAVLDVKFGTNGANVLTGGAPGAVGQSVVVSSGSFSGAVTFDISNNTINGAIDTPINVNKGGGTGTFSGRIQNNFIGTAGVANSGTTGNKDAVRAVTNGAGAYSAVISGNNIRQVSGNGIFAIARDGAGGKLDLTITGNTLSEPNPGNNAIRVESGATSTDDLDVCADIGGTTAALKNTVNGDWGAAIVADELRMRHQFSALCTFRMPGLSGGTTTDVVNHLTARNNGIPPATASATIAGGGSYSGGAACVQPSN